MMAGCSQSLDNLIYVQALDGDPSRYELIRYSTWRIYFYQELESCRTEELSKFYKQGITGALPHFAKTGVEEKFYRDMFTRGRDNEDTARQDSISHFICRMLYCLKEQNHGKFVQMQKNILHIKLEWREKKCISEADRVVHMMLLKRILAALLNCNSSQLDVPEEVWNKFDKKINRMGNMNRQQFAQVDLEVSEIAIRSKKCFLLAGQVYLDTMHMQDLVLWAYTRFLKGKLEAMLHPVLQMLNQDVDDQIQSFLRQTLDSLDKGNFDESTVDRQFKLSLKNIEAVWKRYYPPCMLHLTHKLKQHNHLKHQGRRQLWLFLKACGMELRDNQEYFKNYFQNKMKNSELKSHIYNIAHAYGKEGNKKEERPKLCRNLITAPAPKKDQYHGCPFAHWRKDDLTTFLKNGYSVTETAINEIISQSQEKHFQVACGRLFEAVNLPPSTPKDPKPVLPLEISKMLAKSPHDYFYAGMQLNAYRKNGGKLPSNKNQNKGSKEQNSKLDF